MIDDDDDDVNFINSRIAKCRQIIDDSIGNERF
jgi:hypothetical protein